MNIDYNEACVVEYTHWNNLFKVSNLILKDTKGLSIPVDLLLHIDKTPVQVFDDIEWTLVSATDKSLSKEGELLLNKKSINKDIAETLDKLILNEIFN